MRATRAMAVFATAFGVLIYSQNANALDVSVNASATIVAPLAASSPTALAFGNVGASGSAGTVEVTSAGARSAAGGASAVAGGTVSAAVVNITAGEASAVVDISYPASATLNGPAASTMSVDGFAAAGSPATATLDGSGTATFNVGGTLNVGANQTAGNYTGSFNVTLTYQ